MTKAKRSSLTCERVCHLDEYGDALSRVVEGDVFEVVAAVRKLQNNEFLNFLLAGKQIRIWKKRIFFSKHYLHSEKECLSEIKIFLVADL